MPMPNYLLMTFSLLSSHNMLVLGLMFQFLVPYFCLISRLHFPIKMYNILKNNNNVECIIKLLREK